MATKFISICTLLALLAGPAYSQQKQQHTQEQIDHFAKAEKYRRMKNGGTALTVIGSVLFIAGAVTVLNSFGDEMFYADSNRTDAGVALVIAGEISLGAGIPLWIVGANKERKYNKKLHELNVKINATNNSQGLTLTYRF